MSKEQEVNDCERYMRNRLNEKRKDERKPKAGKIA